MSRFVEAKIKTTEGDEEFLAMHEITAKRIKREGRAPSQFHTNAGGFYEVESITIDGDEIKAAPGSNPQ